MPYFRSCREIEKAVHGINKLMGRWGLKYVDWMIGKEVSFFLEGVITDPRKILRDVTVYVNRRKVPWPVPKNQARLIFPRKNSSFARQYDLLQKKLGIGIDLWPLPDNKLKLSFLTGSSKIVEVDGCLINIESVRKFVYRLTVLSKIFLRLSPNKLREFYFADKKRYRQRLRLYSRIRKGAKTPLDKLGMDKVTQYYKQLTARAYPEIFSDSTPNKEWELSGVAAYSPKKALEGFVAKGSNIKKSKDKYIYVFSHFYPSDTKVLPFAKAILTEGGGTLCHAAIVCREQRIPCMVGVRGLMAATRNNDKVEIDFNGGRVIMQSRSN